MGGTTKRDTVEQVIMYERQEYGDAVLFLVILT